MSGRAVAGSFLFFLIIVLCLSQLSNSKLFPFYDKKYSSRGHDIETESLRKEIALHLVLLRNNFEGTKRNITKVHRSFTTFSICISTLTVSREAFSRITISRFPESFSFNVLGIFRGLSNSLSSSAITARVSIDMKAWLQGRVKRETGANKHGGGQGCAAGTFCMLFS